MASKEIYVEKLPADTLCADETLNAQVRCAIPNVTPSSALRSSYPAFIPTWNAFAKPPAAPNRTGRSATGRKAKK